MLSSTNKCEGDHTQHSHMDYFGNCVQVAKLVRVPYSDLRYTWHNGQHDIDTIFLEARLDLW